MVGKYLTLALCLAVVLSCLVVVKGKYRISWITDWKYYSGTHYWVGFEAFKADGKTKTKWMWPNDQFSTGHFGSDEVDEPSIGDIARVNVHVQQPSGNIIQDDWTAFKVVVSDFETKKTYEFSPGHVDTNAYQKYDVTEIPCQDNGVRCRPEGDHCAIRSPSVSPFYTAKKNFANCLKTCNFCYPPDDDEPGEEEEKEPSEASPPHGYNKKSTKGAHKKKE